MSSRSSPLLSVPHSPCPDGLSEPFSNGAEVHVANLDYRMSRKDLQQTLHDTFSRYGRVRPVILQLHVGFPRSYPCRKTCSCCVNLVLQVKALELSPHTDYQLKATIQMFSLRQAISAVSGLHRYKIGGKRIQVSLITGGSNKSLALLRYRQA